MGADLVTLIVDATSANAEALANAYRPDIDFGECDFANSTHHAIQSHLQTYYKLCLVSAHFSQDDLKSFFDDVNKIERKDVCVFVQVREALEPDFDRASLIDQGFTTVISRAGTYKDKEALKAAIKVHLREFEVARRTIDVNSAIRLLLAEVHRVSEDRRRGRESTFNTLTMDFISMQTEFDAEILNKYYEALIKQCEEAKPVKVAKVKIPKKLLDKKLPNLTDESYIGVSSRVWDKIVKIHGVTEDGTSVKTGKKVEDDAPEQDDSQQAQAPTEAPKE